MTTKKFNKKFTAAGTDRQVMLTAALGFCSLITWRKQDITADRELTEQEDATYNAAMRMLTKEFNRGFLPPYTQLTEEAVELIEDTQNRYPNPPPPGKDSSCHPYG